MGEDVILDFVVVNEDRDADGWTFEEAGVVVDLTSVVLADEDAVLDFFDAGKDVADKTSAFEEVNVVVDAVLRLEETVERRVDRGLVLEDVEEIVIADDDVVPEVL